MSVLSSMIAACCGFRFSICDEEGDEVGHAYFYVMTNDLHERPFGLLEDLYVEEANRGQGYGSTLHAAVVAKARELDCYKLLATSRYSRPEVHAMYEHYGYKDYGKEFRLNLD